MTSQMQQPQAILFDLDGVFYEGAQPIAGGPDVLRWCREQNIAHLFVSNTTSRTRQALVEKLADFGISIDAEALLTPAVAAVQWLRAENAEPTVLFVPDATHAEFAGLEVLPEDTAQAVRSVVVGDLGEAWDYARLNRAFRLLMATDATTLVALGMTRYWRDRGQLRLDAGPFVMALAYASGREPVVLGKPGAAFFATALARLGMDAARTVMIGDDALTDVQAARQAGLQGILVRTGKFQATDLDGPAQPDAVLDSIADLPHWWRQQRA